MRKLVLAGLLAFPAVLISGSTASAQFPQFGFGGGCSGCVGLFSKLNMHGPLFNYGPYSGYYPFEPYGPWTSDLRYNPPAAPCRDRDRHEFALAHKLYAVVTMQNVWKRIQPLSHRVGHCGSGNCAGSVTPASTPVAACVGCAAVAAAK